MTHRCPPRSFAVLAALLLLGVASGCRYAWGPVQHPQIRSLGVGSFANTTKEADANAMLRSALAEAISTEPGIALLQPEEADAIVEGRLVRISQDRLVRARTRDERVVRDDSDAYRTVLYRLEVTVEYAVRAAGTTTPILRSEQVVGQADLGNWPDQQIVQQDALRRALEDAARKIVAAVTEAW